MKKNAGSFDPSFCDLNGPTMASILTQVEQAADILVDGTQDPTKTCDAISIGIGFDAVAVTLGPVVAAPVPTDPCAR